MSIQINTKTKNVPEKENSSPASSHPPLRPSELGGWDVEVKLGELEKPICFTRLFGREAPVEVEIGSGSGVFLSEEAQRRPDINFLAIEKDGKQVRRAKDKWRRRNLLNVRIVRCDAFYFLEEYIPPASVGAYIILYSDPWFKKRHHKRRVFSPRLLPILERTLKPGGLLTIKTDITDYYEVITSLLGNAPFLEKLYDKRIDVEAVEDDIETNFQRKAREQGHPLHAMQYRKS